MGQNRYIPQPPEQRPAHAPHHHARSRDKWEGQAWGPVEPRRKTSKWFWFWVAVAIGVTILTGPFWIYVAVFFACFGVGSWKHAHAQPVRVVRDDRPTHDPAHPYDGL